MGTARLIACALASFAVASVAAGARAEDGTAGGTRTAKAVVEQGGTDAPAAQPPDPTKPMPPPYSLPWGLRPAVAGNVIRSETAVAVQDDRTTVVQYITAAAKLVPDVALGLRVGGVRNSPDEGDAGTAFTNMALSGTWTPRVAGVLRLAPVVGLGLPIAEGGGNHPDAAQSDALAAGHLARGGMDALMYAKNDIVPFAGFGIAYVAHGLTVQADATLLQLFRVRGDEVQKDEAKTNSTFGLHVGYFFVRYLSAGAELRHQRFLTTPSFVEKDPAARDNTSFAVGLRGHLKLADTLWLRPGVAYAQGLDAPMTDLGYHIVQIDLPIAF